MGRKAKGTVLVYQGTRYTWTTKGYWRATTGDRHNLTRRIWEEYYGAIPEGCKIMYKDRNRFNVDIHNLICISDAERQKEAMKDPIRNAINKCVLSYGRLQFKIKASLNPEHLKERGHKIWKTRRERYGTSGGNRGRCKK